MNPKEQIIFVLDDDASMRSSLERLLDSVGLRSKLFSSAREFLNSDLPDIPSCLVTDVRMPGMSGTDLQEELKVAGKEIPIIFITAYGEVSMSVRVMKSGAIDFLEKPFREHELLGAINNALEQDRRNREKRSELNEIVRRLNTLTPREREVLEFVISGMLNKQIAYHLGIVERTIKLHRARIMQKMKVDSLPELVRIAEKAGIQPSTPSS